MEKEIRVLIVEPGKAPRPAMVRNSEETFTAIVGGPFERIGIHSAFGAISGFTPIVAVCRRNGASLGLEPNRTFPGGEDYIAGVFAVCGIDGNDFSSLDQRVMARLQVALSKPGEFLLMDGEVLFVSPEDLAKKAVDLWDSLQEGQSVVMTKWGGRKRGGSS